MFTLFIAKRFKIKNKVKNYDIGNSPLPTIYKTSRQQSFPHKNIYFWLFKNVLLNNVMSSNSLKIFCNLVRDWL